MGFVVDFLGLIYFLHEGDSRLALLPNGTSPGKGDPAPHFASFFIETARVTGDKWWPTQTNPKLVEKGVTEYRIAKPSTITITGISETLRGAGIMPLNTNDHEGVLPKLKDMNSAFDVVPKKADTIARLRIRQGTMVALQYAGSVASRLTVNHAGPITITARSADGVKTIDLKEGTEIVFSNTSDLLAIKEEELDPGPDHFRLYGKLDVHGATEGLIEPPLLPAGIEPLPLDHPYLLKVIEDNHNVPGAGCSNGCC